MTWNRSAPLRQIVQAVAPAARIASVSSAGTRSWACSYSSILSGRTRACSAILIPFLLGDDHVQGTGAVHAFHTLQLDVAGGRWPGDEGQWPQRVQAGQRVRDVGRYLLRRYHAHVYVWHQRERP